jgi:hypothetical protein
MRSAAVEVDELPVAVDTVHRRADERLGWWGEGLEHRDRAQLHAGHDEPLGSPAEEVDEGLHLGQLGHGPTLPVVPLLQEVCRWRVERVHRRRGVLQQ